MGTGYVTPLRDSKFTLVMSKDERVKLDVLARAKMVSQASILRMAIHDAYEEHQRKAKMRGNKK
jgi:predicted transcriptional regulator